jgi:proprotein convertase subtilisin/kexin type 5
MATANLCSSCLPVCLKCSGYSLSLCTSCGNVTSAGVITIYYYQQGTTVCSTTCPSGQFIDINVPNICQKCAIACVTCSITSNNCTGDICASGLYYFNSTCITTCPQGTFGDSNMKCSACEYFLFDGQCIEQCPSGYLGVIGTISTCSPCSDSTCST